VETSILLETAPVVDDDDLVMDLDATGARNVMEMCMSMSLHFSFHRPAHLLEQCRRLIQRRLTPHFLS
jgi:hypothetical protein